MFLFIHSSLGAPLTTARREPPAEAAEEVGDLGAAEDGGDVEAVSEDMVGLSPAAGQGRGVAAEPREEGLERRLSSPFQFTCVRRDAASGPRSPVDEWRSEQYESSFLGREALPRCRQYASPPSPKTRRVDARGRDLSN